MCECSKPIWDIVAHVVMSVPVPSGGKGQVLFSLESYLLTVEAPPKDGFPHADVGNWHYPYYFLEIFY